MEPIARVNSKFFFLISYSALLLTFIVVYAVIFRYFLGRADVRAFFFSVWLYGMLSILAGGYVLKMGGHVSVDILYKRFSERVKHYLDLFSLSIIAVVCVVLLYPGVEVAWRSTLVGEVDSSLGIVFAPPIWWYRWVAVIGLLLILLQAIELLYSKIRSV